MRLGREPRSGALCEVFQGILRAGIGTTAAISEDSSDQPFSYFSGTVPEAATRVELRTFEGKIARGLILESPAELELPFDFYVGFTAPDTDVQITVRDEHGRAIRHENHETLPNIRVTKDGSGAGRVTAIEAGWPKCDGCPDARKWIDCGPDCVATAEVGRHGTDFMLEAHPAPGSVFEGWEVEYTERISRTMTQSVEDLCGWGSTGTCQLTLRKDSEIAVTAHFERS